MQTALANFRNEIARIDKVADWLTTAPALVPDMAPATWAVRCGAVVLFSGYLESFIRECMRAFIRDVNALGHPLTKLPESMKHTHFDVGAKVLRWQLRLDKRAGLGGQSKPAGQGQLKIDQWSVGSFKTGQ